MGPTVWELEGPIPTLKMSNTLKAIFFLDNVGGPLNGSDTAHPFSVRIHGFSIQLRWAMPCR